MLAVAMLVLVLLFVVDVDSNDLFLGNLTPKSRLLLSDVHQALMAPWTRTRHITVQGHADEVISAVRVYDLRKKKDGVARLDGGEVGGPKVTLGLRSAGPFRPFAFKIEIYAERSKATADIDNKSDLTELVKNITKAMIQEAIQEMLFSQDEEEEESKPTPRTIKKKKRKKSKTSNKRKTNDNPTKNQTLHVPRTNVSRKNTPKLGQRKKSMVFKESGSGSQKLIPPLSGVYSRWTNMTLPTVQISDDLDVKDVATPYALPGTADVGFDNLL